MQNFETSSRLLHRAAFAALVLGTSCVSWSHPLYAQETSLKPQAVSKALIKPSLIANPAAIPSAVPAGTNAPGARPATQGTTDPGKIAWGVLPPTNANAPVKASAIGPSAAAVPGIPPTRSPAIALKNKSNVTTQCPVGQTRYSGPPYGVAECLPNWQVTDLQHNCPGGTYFDKGACQYCGNEPYDGARPECNTL